MLYKLYFESFNNLIRRRESNDIIDIDNNKDRDSVFINLFRKDRVISIGPSKPYS